LNRYNDLLFDLCSYLDKGDVPLAWWVARGPNPDASLERIWSRSTNPILLVDLVEKIRRRRDVETLLEDMAHEALRDAPDLPAKNEVLKTFSVNRSATPEDFSRLVQLRNESRVDWERDAYTASVGFLACQSGNRSGATVAYYLGTAYVYLAESEGLWTREQTWNTRASEIIRGRIASPTYTEILAVGRKRIGT
jgi:hypothetical protein